jgi:hypothetical protein
LGRFFCFGAALFGDLIVTLAHEPGQRCGGRLPRGLTHARVASDKYPQALGIVRASTALIGRCGAHACRVTSIQVSALPLNSLFFIGFFAD